MIRVNNANIESFVAPNYAENLLPELNTAQGHLQNGTGAGNDFIGWVNLPRDYDKEEYARIKAAAAKIQGDSQALVVIGIGGSYLGTESFGITSPFARPR